MKKKGKFLSKLAALVVAAATTVSLAACGGPAAEPSKPVEPQNATAIMESVKQPENVDATFKMEFDIKQGTNALSASANMNAVNIGSEKIKMTMDVAMGGQTLTSMESYIVKEKSAEDEAIYRTYVKAADSDWIASETTDITAIEKQLQNTNTDTYTDLVEELTIDGTEEVNGVTTTVITGKLPLSTMAKQLEQLGDFSDTKSDVLAKFFVDTEKNRIVKMNIDMTDVLNEIMTKQMESESVPVDLDMKIEKVFVELVINKADDEVKDFKVPAEALAANDELNLAA